MADKKNVRIDETAVKKTMSRKKVVAVFVVCSVLALVICMTSVLAVAFSLITEGTYEFPEEKAPSLSLMPIDNDGTVEYLKMITDKASDSIHTRFDKKTEISIDDETLDIDGGESEKNVLKYVKNKLLPSVRELYPDDLTGEFGEKPVAPFPVVSLIEGDYKDAVTVEGATDENGEPIDDDYWFLDIDVVGTSFSSDRKSGVTDTFNSIENVNVYTDFVEKIKSDIKLLTFKAEPLDFHISAKSNRLNDNIQSLSLTENYKITLTAEFLGALSEFGTKTISFEYKVVTSYDYSWAGVSLAEKLLTVQPGDEQSVSVKAVINDDSEYTVKFTSSDTSVATVNEMGYVKGVKESDKPVTITVTLSYLGEEYSDTCEVFVRTPVEKITVSDSKLTLEQGESATLTAKLKPASATDKKIIWISEDKTVATVDENGCVTAKGVGTATIIAVSDDGSLRDSCTVTVVKGGDTK